MGSWDDLMFNPSPVSSWQGGSPAAAAPSAPSAPAAPSQSYDVNEPGDMFQLNRMDKNEMALASREEEFRKALRNAVLKIQGK